MTLDVVFVDPSRGVVVLSNGDRVEVPREQAWREAVRIVRRGEAAS